MKTLDFMIIGAQKSGTTALSHFLSLHPEVTMSEPKEVHLFDAVDYSTTWTPEQINNRYKGAFSDALTNTKWGEATPIYMFLPEIAAELNRYNSELKLLVLLRDPVARAMSHYWMEKERGAESLPISLALLAEPVRLLLDTNARVDQSATRLYSYRKRGLYSQQLRNLYNYFDASQIMIVSQSELIDNHDRTLREVFQFLQVDAGVTISPEIIFSRYNGNDQEISSKKHCIIRLLLKLGFLLEYWRIRRYVSFSIRSWMFN